jgi:hypothetical protein
MVAVIFGVVGLLVYFVAEKTLWDLLALLVVPLALAVIGFGFTMQQDARQQKFEHQRAEAERELANQRAQDEALQAYLDQMSTLLLENDVRSSTKKGEESRTLVRARTLAVLGSLGSDLGQRPDRKRTVLQFLYEASLINANKYPYVPLESANINQAYLYYADLENARLPLVFLKGANLFHTTLADADLGGAILSDANLSGANLSGANLHAANLSNADLSDADLHAANLSNADLSGAKGITGDDLERQASSLQSAVMPDGTLHAGPYVTLSFDPALSFIISKGWQRPHPEAINLLYLHRGPQEGVVAFASPRHVFDPNNPGEREEVTAPGNAREWVSWFQRHPSLDNLDRPEPVPQSVAGASGFRIDVTTASTPEKYPRDLCDKSPCVPLFPASGFPSGIVSYDHWKDRFIIVEVGGEPVVIDIGAPAGKFDDFLPKAQKVLDTVEWKGG